MHSASSWTKKTSRAKETAAPDRKASAKRGQREGQYEENEEEKEEEEGQDEENEGEEEEEDEDEEEEDGKEKRQKKEERRKAREDKMGTTRNQKHRGRPEPAALSGSARKRCRQNRVTNRATTGDQRVS